MHLKKDTAFSCEIFKLTPIDTKESGLLDWLIFSEKKCTIFDLLKGFVKILHSNLSIVVECFVMATTFLMPEDSVLT